jgi:rhomboid family GlyGly-CTERM serine protease
VVVAPPALTRIPWWSLGLVAVALLAQGFDGAADLLVYDRKGLAAGELWRLLTGHLVHFSAAHLVNNLLVVVPAVWLVETRYRKDTGPLLLAAASAVGIAVFVGATEIQQFGGASGISLAVLTYACMRGLHENRRWRMVCGILLAVVCAKLTAEFFWSWGLLDWQANGNFVPVPLSHLVGTATGAALYVWRVASEQVFDFKCGRYGNSPIRTRSS